MVTVSSGKCYREGGLVLQPITCFNSPLLVQSICHSLCQLSRTPHSVSLTLALYLSSSLVWKLIALENTHDAVVPFLRNGDRMWMQCPVDGCLFCPVCMNAYVCMCDPTGSSINNTAWCDADKLNHRSLLKYHRQKERLITHCSVTGIFHILEVNDHSVHVCWAWPFHCKQKSLFSIPIIMLLLNSFV